MVLVTLVLISYYALWYSLLTHFFQAQPISVATASSAHVAAAPLAVLAKTSVIPSELGKAPLALTILEAPISAAVPVAAAVVTVNKVLPVVNGTVTAPSVVVAAMPSNWTNNNNTASVAPLPLPLPAIFAKTQPLSGLEHNEAVANLVNMVRFI